MEDRARVEERLGVAKEVLDFTDLALVDRDRPALHGEKLPVALVADERLRSISAFYCIPVSTVPAGLSCMSRRNRRVNITLRAKYSLAKAKFQ